MAAAWFSTFLLKAFVSLVNRRIDIRASESDAHIARSHLINPATE